MATNKNWPRWIFASVSKHFDANKDTLPLFIEGQYRNTRSEKDFLELRVDGPYFTEFSKGYWRAFIEINVLVQSAMDDSNFHRIHEDVGIAAAAFSTIHVYKYGNGVDDDGTLLGCLKLVADHRGKERIQINHFGQIGPSEGLMQACVEGHYEMFLDES